MKSKIFVYFIHAVKSGRIKIGASVSPSRRMTELSTSCPDDLVLLGVTEDATETDIHARFRQFRVQGEWFDADQSVFDYISLHCSQDVVTQRADAALNRNHRTQVRQNAKKQAKQQRHVQIGEMIMKGREFEKVGGQLLQYICNRTDSTAREQLEPLFNKLREDVMRLAEVTGAWPEDEGLRREVRRRRAQREDAQRAEQYQASLLQQLRQEQARSIMACSD